MKRRDDHTPDLFAAPDLPARMPGASDYRPLVAAMVSELLKEAAGKGLDRYEVASRMSRAAGREISKYMLDAWSAESRDDHNIPFALVPLLEDACESFLLSTWLAVIRGGRLFIGRDALNAELGLIQRHRDDLSARIRLMRDQLRKGS